MLVKLVTGDEIQLAKCQAEILTHKFQSSGPLYVYSIFSLPYAILAPSRKAVTVS